MDNFVKTFVFLLHIGCLVSVNGIIDLADRYHLQYNDIICEGAQLQIYCPSDYVLTITRASYGRSESGNCAQEGADSGKSTTEQCAVDGVYERLVSQCDGQSTCYLDTLVQDPDGQCADVYSYLDVSFYCAMPVTQVLGCADERITLSCSGDDAIMVLGAYYGRANADTCLSQNIASLSSNCTGDRALAGVGTLCNGKQNCDVTVSGGLLGDACDGESKYLEIAYACASCVNTFGNDEGCREYDSWGECEANPDWMTAYCRQACFACQYTDLCNNTGDDADCDLRASRGECESEGETMTSRCRKSCNRCHELVDAPPDKKSPVYKEVCEQDAVALVCDDGYFVRVDDAMFGRLHNDTCANDGVVDLDCPSPDDVLPRMRTLCEGREVCWFEAHTELWGDPCPGNGKMGRVDYTCQRCYNAYLDSACEAMAAQGECTSKREWMMDHCYRSCTGCYSPVDCPNKFGNDVDCDFWAVRDGCNDWMSENCAQSCHTCDDSDPRFPDSIYEVVCHEQNLTLTCDNNQFVSIDIVFFGRDDVTLCAHADGNVTNCEGAPRATEIAGRVCNGRPNCSFEARPLEWGDPCPGVNKFARVKYHCQDCVNLQSDEFCDAKAMDGACVDDYLFMHAHCFKTCSKCDLQVCGNSYGNDKDCDYWSMRDGCRNDSANPEWMRENCEESCGVCPARNESDFTTTPAPVVTEPVLVEECEAGVLPMSCASGYSLWIQDMFFGRNSLDTCPHEHANTTSCEAFEAEALVRQYCNGKSSCYVSLDTAVFGDPCAGVSKHGSVTYACHECVNALDDSECELRASEEKCEDEYDTMMSDCFKTCSKCDLHDCVNAYNSEENCYYWAQIGECEANPDWMYDNCRLACNLCQGEPTEPPLATQLPMEALEKQEPVFLQACEGQNMELSCNATYHLRLDLIYYGRYGNETCAHESVQNDTSCPPPNGLFSRVADLCNGRPGPCYYELLTSIWGDTCPGVAKQGHVQYTCQKCVNILEDSECEQRQADDECNTNYIDMMDLCFKTCTKCDEAVCANAHSSPIDCDYWQTQGFCDTDAPFMYRECAASCGVCVDKTCPSGFKGEGCAEYDCPDVEQCNGRGECTDANTCTCESGYTGDTCANYTCNGVNQCSNNGRCYGPNQCLCYPYFSGADCGQCYVEFEAGPNCIPCPDCDHGSCVSDAEPLLGPMIDVTANQDGGTYKQLIKEGTGTDMPQPGDTIYSHYYGTLTDGTFFDASRPRGNMFIYKASTGYVIDGWEHAIPTMIRGEISLLTIHADDAYGSSGLGQSIPPNATLLIRVELIDFRNTCSDDWSRSNCLDRKARGECESDIELMTLRCERTCAFCGEPESYPEDCTNYQSDCEYWSGIGECELNPEYMLVECPRACNQCGDQCTNALTTWATDEDCDYWAKIGECDKENRDWMLANCRRSCGFCDNPPPSKDECANEHMSDVNCDRWAREGECEVEASIPVLHTICRKSCGLCDAVRAPNVEAYQGCFRASESDMSHVVWSGRATSTVECMQECHTLGYKYAATTQGNTCHCGNSYGSAGEAVGECVTPCQGTPGDYCGGTDAHAVWKLTEGRCECENSWSGELCDVQGDTTTTTTTTTQSTTPTATQAVTSNTPHKSSAISSSTTTTTTTPNVTSGDSSTTFDSTTTSSTTSANLASSSVAASGSSEARVNVALEIGLDAPWNRNYANLSHPDTIFFLNEIEPYLLQLYNDLFDNTVLSIQITGLREGSVIIEHELALSENMNEHEVVCDVMHSLADRQTLGDHEVTSQLEITDCNWTHDYCENDGDFYVSTEGKWKCNCKDGTSGRRCENEDLKLWHVILIAVGCCLLLIAIVAITCVVIHRRNHTKMERLKSERRAEANAYFPQANNVGIATTQFMGKTRGTLRSAKRLFSDTKGNHEEIADTEGFVPRQI